MLKPQQRNFSNPSRTILIICLFGLSLLYLFYTLSYAEPAIAQDIAQGRMQDITQTANSASFDAIATLWLTVATLLVFFMNTGFAMLETGFCRTGNAVNVLAKNLIVFCIAAIAFWLFGFRYMFGDSSSLLVGQIGLPASFSFPSTAGTNAFPPGFQTLQASWSGRPFTSVFLFQLVFAGTTATIVSGAVAERIKFWGFILFSFLLVGFIYPIAGYWIWGQGWLFALPIQFRDFAGATVVHVVGGIAALTGALMLGPRQGKFGFQFTEPAVEIEPIGSASTSSFSNTQSFGPHNMSLATLGCLILWLGWLGFNGGSTSQLTYLPHVLLTTLLSASAGGIGAVIFSPFVTDQKARLSSIINGILGGLVGITASAAYVSAEIAILIGAFSALLVLYAQRRMDYWKIDDPVGAVPVHLVCGIWGTLCVGLFASPISAEYQIENYSRIIQTGAQLLGILSVFVAISLFSLLAWLIVGILLYNLEANSEKARRIRLNQAWLNPAYDYKKIGLFPYLFRISRHGLRVSLTFEKQGGSPSITP